MKISATSSGGFTGQTHHYHLDTADASNGRSIEALVRDLGFFSSDPPEAIGADLIRWTITIDDADRHRSVRFADDGSAGAAPWQTLLVQLRAA
jgi:hypothetical protein